MAKHWKKSAVKHSIEKPILLNFENFSPKYFYSRLEIFEGVQIFPQIFKSLLRMYVFSETQILQLVSSLSFDLAWKVCAISSDISMS